MADDKFINDFYKLLSPIDKWDGEFKSFKELFDIKLVQYGITQNQAESLLGMQKRTLEGILDMSAKRVDVVSLLKLGQFLGLDVSALMKAFVNGIPVDVTKDLSDARTKSFLISNFDIKNLAKSGFIKQKNDFDYIESRVKKFFNIDFIEDYVNKFYIPAFSRTKRNASTLMREFWVRSAFVHFEKLNNPNKFDRKALVELMPKIRPYTMNVEKGLKTVTQALFNIGVTVIYQPHLPTTQVRGATFVVHNKPCVALTDLNKNYATVWFALIHELHHVLYDFEEIEKQIFHLTGEADLFLLQEDAANEFSRNFLFSNERSNYINAHIGNHYIVSEYAKESQIHPSIIYNFYCYDMEKTGKGKFWGRFKQYDPDIKIALKELNVNSFENESIDETVKYLKEKVFNF
ncbi:MAG: hypothetical protein K2Q24_16335 [Chitinophagaceae bacterium]|nr:hypothetical protein [Chitinophagaceae bacterium]